MTIDFALEFTRVTCHRGAAREGWRVDDANWENQASGWSGIPSTIQKILPVWSVPVGLSRRSIQSPRALRYVFDWRAALRLTSFSSVALHGGLDHHRC